MWKHHTNDYDYFMKVDHDSYVNARRLRVLLTTAQTEAYMKQCSCKDLDTPFPPPHPMPPDARLIRASFGVVRCYGHRMLIGAISNPLALTLAPLPCSSNVLCRPPSVQCGAPDGSLARASCFPAVDLAPSQTSGCRPRVARRSRAASVLADGPTAPVSATCSTLSAWSKLFQSPVTVACAVLSSACCGRCNVSAQKAP